MNSTNQFYQFQLVFITFICVSIVILPSYYVTKVIWCLTRRFKLKLHDKSLFTKCHCHRCCATIIIIYSQWHRLKMSYKNPKFISPSFTNIDKISRSIKAISINETMPSAFEISLLWHLFHYMVTLYLTKQSIVFIFVQEVTSKL